MKKQADEEAYNRGRANEKEREKNIAADEEHGPKIRKKEGKSSRVRLILDRE